MTSEEKEMGEKGEILKEISIERIETHIKNLEGIRHPVFAPEALEDAADYILNTLQSLGYKMSLHYFGEDGKQYRNIIGEYQGTRQSEKKVVVISHFDTVATSPGADDNASGVAAMLELARVLRRCKFEKSILFIGVNLEEQKIDGEKDSPFLRGSRALAAYARERGWEIEGVINFETIAYAGETIAQTAPKNIPLEIPEVGNFIAVIGNENSAEIVKDYIEVIEQYQIPLPYLPLIVPGNGEMLPDTRRSDHASFWDNGYRAIMLTDTANFRTPHYHQESDTLDTLNLSFATEVCRAGGGLVFKMAGFVNP
jgi:Zn-dependent M28 family amino/carboxypeptidase